jgi:hypothetical protein
MLDFKAIGSAIKTLLVGKQVQIHPKKRQSVEFDIDVGRMEKEVCLDFKEISMDGALYVHHINKDNRVARSDAYTPENRLAEVIGVSYNGEKHVVHCVAVPALGNESFFDAFAASLDGDLYKAVGMPEIGESNKVKSFNRVLLT